MLASDYDPEIGRWTSKDPILFGGGDTNLYGYFVDSLGSWGFQFGIGAGCLRRIGRHIQRQPCLQIGGYASSQWNAGIGDSAGRGIQISVSPNACSLQDLGGTSTVAGVDLPAFGMSVSGTSANPTFGASFGPWSLGTAIYGGVSGTQVFPFYMSSPQGTH